MALLEVERGTCRQQWERGPPCLGTSHVLCRYLMLLACFLKGFPWHKHQEALKEWLVKVPGACPTPGGSLVEGHGPPWGPYMGG